MDFEARATSVAHQVASAQSSLDLLSSQLDYAATKTEELLAIASDVGVTAVSIGKRHPLVGNENWPFGTSGSIFTHPDARVNGSPAAWRIADAAGISGGAGNAGQHQTDNSQLIDGVYQHKDGAWLRVDLQSSDN